MIGQVITFPVKKRYAFTDTGDRVTSIGIRITGKEEMDALDRLVTDPGDSATAKQKQQYATERAEMMLALAIAEVNGQPVEKPYKGFAKWSSQAQTAALVANREVNGFDEDDAKDFRQGAGTSPASAPGTGG